MTTDSMTRDRTAHDRTAHDRTVDDRTADDRTADDRTRAEGPPLQLEVAAALLVPAATVGFVRIFEAPSAVGPLLGGAALSTLVAILARRARLPLLASLVVSTAALVVLVTRRFAPGTERYEVLPTGRTLETLRVLFDDGISAFREMKAPVESLDPFLAAALIACWVMAFLTDWGALRLRLAFEPVLPAGLLFLFSSVLGSGQHRITSTVVFVSAVLVWSVVQRATDLGRHAVWLAVDRRRGPATVAVGGAVLGALALVAGLVVGPFLPGAGSGQWFDWRNPGDPVRTVISPFVSIEARLVEQSNVRLFTVRSERPAYWRLAGLDSYEDGFWSTKGSFEQHDRALPGLAPRAGTTTTVRQEFRIEALDAIWLPAAFAPSSIVESDAPLTWNADTGSLTVDNSRDTSDGVTYTVDSVVPFYTPDELRAASGPVPTDIAETYLALPADLTPRVRAQAVAVTAGAATTYDRMIALQEHFRGYDYSVSLPPREGDPIEQFLDERLGFCQQFSGTFALMARALGAPARVAVGFTWGDPLPGEEGLYVVSGRQAHAWPEVWFPDLGWVAFEPTPGRGSPDATHNPVDAAQDSLVQPDRPGQATTTTSTVTGGPGGAGPDTQFEPGFDLPDEGLGPVGSAQQDDPFPVWLIVVLGSAVGYLVGVPVWHRLRRIQRARRASSPRARIDAAWADATEAIELATGLIRPPATTRAAWARQLGNDLRVPGDELRDLAEVVTRARFDPSNEPSADDVARAEAAARAVEQRVYGRLDRSRRWRAELDPRRLIRPTRRPLTRR